MSSTHKISALRSLATKVALGLGIALVASSIAPVAVAPASATNTDHALIAFGVSSNFSDCLTTTWVAGTTASYDCGIAAGASVSIYSGVYVQGQSYTANASLSKVHNSVSTVVSSITGQAPSNIIVTGLVTGDSLVVTDVGGLVYTINIVPRVYRCALNTLTMQGPTGTFASTNSNTVLIANGAQLEAPVSSRQNYVLSGWVDMAQQVYSNTAAATCNATTQDLMLYPSWTYTPPTISVSETFNPNGGQGTNVVVTGTSLSVIIPANPTHSDNTCTFLGWGSSSSAANPINGWPAAGQAKVGLTGNFTYYAVWSSASCRTSQQQNNPPAQPAPQLDLSGLKAIPVPAAGVTGGVAGIDLKGKNLPTVASVTVAGKDGKVVTSTDSALKLDLPTMAPGSYDIVMKTEAGGSITIQNGLVIAPPVDTTPVKPVVITPSVPRTKLVAATTPVPGFQAGKKSVSEAQKAIIQDVVLTKNVTALECVGVTNAKVSAKLASARAAAICAAAKAQNPSLTTSVKTVAEAKVNGPIGSVLINYNR